MTAPPHAHMHNTERPQSQSLPATLKSQKHRYYSGLQLEIQPSEDIPQLYERTVRIARAESPYSERSNFITSRIPSSATRDVAAQGEMPYSSGETLVGNDSKTSSQDQRHNIHMQADIGNESYVEAPLDVTSDVNSMPYVAPSLSRPPAPVPSRLVRKKRVENLQDASQESQSNNTESEAKTEPATKSTGVRPRHRYSWLPNTTTTGTRPLSAMELGAPPAVIIDSNGKRHTMSSDEELKRHRDLQQAVREKMYTGMIKPRPVSDTHHPRPWVDCSYKADSGIEGTNEAGPQLSRRKSILKKLSSFSFAKLRNGKPWHQEGLGFNRIVDTV